MDFKALPNLQVSHLLFAKTMSEPLTFLPRLDHLLAEAAQRVAKVAREAKEATELATTLHLRISSLPAVPYFSRRVVPRAACGWPRATPGS